MENEILDTSFAIHLQTQRGEITVEAGINSKTVRYHYKPIDRMEPYFNGPLFATLNTPDIALIQEALHRSWIKPTPHRIAVVAKAAIIVRKIANDKSLWEL